MREQSLREQIVGADSIPELERLLSLLERHYPQASGKTRNRCQNAARRRMSELRNGKAQAK